MYIEKKLKLGNNFYFVNIEVEYKKCEQGITKLSLLNYNDDYFDSGALSNLIEKVEKHYTTEKAKYYDNQISFMADVLYIYDRIPILSAIKEIYLSKDNLPCSIDCIAKNEIKKYIEEKEISMMNNKHFKLRDEQTWYL